MDWYGPYAPEKQSNPLGSSDGYVKICRGGSYDIPSWQDDNARYCRSANRSGRLPGDGNRNTGFRILMGTLPTSKPRVNPPPALNARDIRQTPAPQTGPDSKRPYFDDFKDRRPTIPENTWGEENSCRRVGGPPARGTE